MVVFSVNMRARTLRQEDLVDTNRSLIKNFRQGNSNVIYSLIRDPEKENTFCLVGEWETDDSLDRFFQSGHFTVMTEAMHILGKTYDIRCIDFSERGRISRMVRKAAPVPVSAHG